MSSEGELYYLKCTKTNRYHSMRGLVGLDQADTYTELQVKTRIGVAVTHTVKFREKLAASYLTMEPVVEKEKGFRLESDIEYEPDDILFCDAEYHYSGRVVRKKGVVYSPYRGTIRTPGGKIEPDLVVFRVVKLVGKVNLDV